MKKRKTIMILFVVILLSQVLILQPTNSITPIIKNSIPSIQSVEQPIISELTTDAPPGTEKVKANVIDYGGFEEANPSGSPDALYDYGSGHIHLNHSYQDEVYAGSYGGYQSSRGTPQYPSYASDGRYMEYTPQRSYLDQKIYLDFWYNVKENPDYTTGAEAYFRFRFYSNVGNHYLYYYLSRVSGLPGNGTTTKYIDIRGGINSWINVQRNVTYDFEQVFTTGADLSLTYIGYTYFHTYSPINPSGDIVLLYDEISITNDTGFDFMQLNGDFELGNSNYWSDYDSGPGSCYQTDIEYTQGNFAMNMTANSPTTSSNANIYAEKELYAGWGTVPKSYYLSQPGDLTFSFDWKYTDTPTLGSQFAYFIIYSQNTTYSSYIYVYLGNQADDISGYTNQTYPSNSYLYVTSDFFGSRNQWNTENIDLYTLYNNLNLPNQVPYYYGFNVNCNNIANGKTQLLVDDLQVITYPAPDPSFEGNVYYDPSDPIWYWQTPENPNYVNVTTDAYTGNWAANLSSYSGYTNVYCRKPTFLPINDINLFTDFYWRLDSMTDTGQFAYAELRLEIDNSRIIHYVLGNNSLYNPTNGTNDCYYFVEGHNQIGSWNNVFRRLLWDVSNAFGPGNWNVTRIDLMCHAQGSEVVKLIIDDVHFARDIQGPQYNNLLQNPANPEYGQAVEVSVDITDNILLSVINCNYKIGLSSWATAPLTVVGDTYTATIPGADYGETVSYYFEAFDVHYHETELGSEMNPYEYVVDDFTDPVLQLEIPPESQILNGTILFNITDAYDLGSGIAAFEIIINEIVVYSNTTFPATYAWNTEIYENIYYTVIFRLEDNAGNFVEEVYLYAVFNPPTGWETFKAFMQKWYPYITAGAGALLIGILVIVIVVRRKKRIA